MAEMTNRSRGGRPAGGGDRVDELKVRLKAGEKEAIREKARQRGFSSMTDFVRHELLTRRFAGEQGGLTLTQFTQVVQLIREYKAIGNNINQIARKANTLTAGGETVLTYEVRKAQRLLEDSAATIERIAEIIDVETLYRMAVGHKGKLAKPEETE